MPDSEASGPLSLRKDVGRRRRKARLCVGCSGWNYASWKGRFYPDDLPRRLWLRYYAERFDTVEVNNTFYRLPEVATFASWRAQLPASFVMAIKASRFLTHIKRLRDPEEPLDRLFSRAMALRLRLGPVLYQLPGTFGIDLSRLETFLDALPPRTQHAIEFRNPSWYVDQTYDCLERHRVALCLHDKAGSAISEPLVGPFVYVRFHGTTGRYHGSYGSLALRAWARRLASASDSGRDVYAYFNNDPDAIATRNALSLKRHLHGLSRR